MSPQIAEMAEIELDGWVEKELCVRFLCESDQVKINTIYKCLCIYMCVYVHVCVHAKRFNYI